MGKQPRTDSDEKEMQKNIYKKELNQIEASEEFKTRTKKFLAQQLEQADAQAKTHPKAVWFSPRRIAGMAAALAVLVVGGLVLKNTIATLQDKIANIQEQKQFLAMMDGTGMVESSLATAEPKQSWYFAPAALLKEAGSQVPNAALPSAAAAPAPRAALETAPAAEEAEELPLLPVEWPAWITGADATCLYQKGIEEHLSDWPQSEPVALPVYRNTKRQSSQGYLPSGPAQPALEALIAEQAAALNQSIQEYTATSIPTEEEGETQGLYSVTGTAQNGTTFTALRNEQVEIVFAAPLPLAATAQEDMAAHQSTLQTLMQEYAPLLHGMKNPTGVVVLNRNAAGEPFWTYQVYDKIEESDAAFYAGRSLSGLWFVTNAEGQLTGLTMRRAGVQQPVGMYPLLPLQKAKEKLLAGEGISPMEGAAPQKMEQIAKVEIVYLENPEAQFLLPFYKFYVAVSPQPEGLPQGLESFAEWIVPAVDPAFLQSGKG